MQRKLCVLCYSANLFLVRSKSYYELLCLVTSDVTTNKKKYLNTATSCKHLKAAKKTTKFSKNFKQIK